MRLSVKVPHRCSAEVSDAGVLHGYYRDGYNTTPVFLRRQWNRIQKCTCDRGGGGADVERRKVGTRQQELASERGRVTPIGDRVKYL